MLKVLQTFQPKSELDEKLLDGILRRPEKRKKNKKNKNKDHKQDEYVRPRPARLPVRDRKVENLEPLSQTNSINARVKPNAAVEMSDRQVLNQTTSRDNSSLMNNGTSLREPRESDN